MFFNNMWYMFFKFHYNKPPNNPNPAPIAAPIGPVAPNMGPNAAPDNAPPAADVIGFALGPFALGFFNDFIFNEANGYDQTGIRYSLLWIGIILYPIAALCFYKSSKLFMPLQAEAQ